MIKNGAETKHLNSTRTARPPRAWQFESNSNATEKMVHASRDCPKVRIIVPIGYSFIIFDGCLVIIEAWVELIASHNFHTEDGAHILCNSWQKLWFRIKHMDPSIRC